MDANRNGEPIDYAVNDDDVTEELRGILFITKNTVYVSSFPSSSHLFGSLRGRRRGFCS